MIVSIWTFNLETKSWWFEKQIVKMVDQTNIFFITVNSSFHGDIDVMDKDEDFVEVKKLRMAGHRGPVV